VEGDEDIQWESGNSRLVENSNGRHLMIGRGPESPLHSPTYSSWNTVIPASPIGISRIPFIFFIMYFTLYRAIPNRLMAHLGSGVTRI
jgi:hypothetical protein